MSTNSSLIQQLRQKGFRITPQREMIIKAITESNQHMSAEQVYERVRQRTQAINLATIYRTLDLLVEQGLVCRNDLGGGRIKYATQQHGTHIHLVCRQCGCVIDAEYSLIAPLADQFRARYDFEADLQHISISGLCQDCQKGEQTS
jgi:Fur family ferric uptake transcriptional regulator